MAVGLLVRALDAEGVGAPEERRGGLVSSNYRTISEDSLMNTEIPVYTNNFTTTTPTPQPVMPQTVMVTYSTDFLNHKYYVLPGKQESLPNGQSWKRW